jgi:hypothetical protein
MFKLSPNSYSAKLVQALLAIGYVALIRHLLAIQASFFGGGGSGLWHISVVLVIVSVGLFLLFLFNFALLRHSFLRLGLFATSAIFIYYYIYNPQGHYMQLIAGLLRSPPHFINMFLLVASPVLVGRYLQFRFSTGAVHA